MKYLYANNFRGFTKTVVPFEAMNFLVGENSTGKTSILALLHILNSHTFWNTNQFKTQDFDFGGFKDIVSANAGESEFFTVGILQKARSQREGKDRWIGILASFKDAEGLPSLSYFAHLNGNRLQCVRSGGESDSYCTREMPPDFAAKSPEHIFSTCEEQFASDTEYKEFPRKYGTLKNTPMGILLQIIPIILQSDDAPAREAFHEGGFQMMAPFVWLAPIRTQPRRTYDGYGKEYSPEGEHTPYELRKILKSGVHSAAFQSALTNFGKASGLFKKVTIHSLGKGVASAFELCVTLSNTPLRINSVGYGVSQVLPVIVETLVRPKGMWFAIQQPEVHLHPRAQAALGDVFFQLCEAEGKNFVIETHSDFLVDRFKLRMESSKGHKVKAQVIFCERSGNGNKLSIIPIEADGAYSSQQPATFRDFFVKEQLNILGI